MRTRAELDAIRAANRSRLGLAGGHVLHRVGAGAVTDVLTGITFRTSFPEVEATWRPGATTPAAESGFPWDRWLFAHVIRPSATVDTPFGPVDVDPYRDEADYSGPARLAAVGLGIAGALGFAWLVGRAL